MDAANSYDSGDAFMTDGRKHHAQSTADEVEGWPRGVRPISMDGVGMLGVGDDGSLYWEGKPIEVRRSFALSWWQRVGAIVVAGSAVIGAGAAAVSAYADVAALH